LKLRDYLHECFSYDNMSGVLWWNIRPREHFKGGAGWHNFNRQRAHTIAGFEDKQGRTRIKLDGREWKAARIVWVMFHGALPTAVDHINGDVSDDRIENLRAVNHQQNAMNRSHKSSNSSGFVGVTKHADGWWARITINGKTISLKVHKDKQDAINAVLEAKQKYFREYARKTI